MVVSSGGFFSLLFAGAASRQLKNSILVNSGFPPYFSRNNQKRIFCHNRSLVCEEQMIPIVNEILHFVSGNNYASAFGEQWKRYRESQLHSYTGQPITEMLKLDFRNLFNF